jgi:hypothetical protein
MSLLDILNPPSIEIKGARKVNVMTKRDDKEDQKYAEEMDFTNFLKNKAELLNEKRNEAIRSMKLRRLKDAVKRDRARLKKSEKDLEEALAQ